MEGGLLNQELQVSMNYHDNALENKEGSWIWWHNVRGLHV